MNFVFFYILQYVLAKKGHVLSGTFSATYLCRGTL